MNSFKKILPLFSKFALLLLSSATLAGASSPAKSTRSPCDSLAFFTQHSEVHIVDGKNKLVLKDPEPLSLQRSKDGPSTSRLYIKKPKEIKSSVSIFIDSEGKASKTLSTHELVPSKSLEGYYELADAKISEIFSAPELYEGLRFEFTTDKATTCSKTFELDLDHDH